MKSIRKRLTVVNDGFCNRKKPASERVLDAAIRYVNKMYKKGWFPTFYCAGDNMSLYECFLYMTKSKNEKEQEIIKGDSIDHGWQFENGVCIGNKCNEGFYR